MIVNFEFENSATEILRISAENGHVDILGYLVENGVDFQTNNNNAVRLASRNGHLEVVKYLVERGADFRDDDNDVIKMASMNGHLDIVEYLTDKGVDLRVRNDIALMAYHHGYFEIVEYLMTKGITIEISERMKEYIERGKTKWSPSLHISFPEKTCTLFGTLLSGIQRLEENGVLQLAYQAMIEEMLEE